MRRFGLLLLVGVVIFSLAGCVTVKKVVRERVDQDLDGNQGYLEGSGAPSSEPRPKDREYIDVKIEVPTWGEMRGEPARTEEASSSMNADSSKGNKGYVSGSRGSGQDVPKTYRYEDTEVIAAGEAGAVVYEEESLIPTYQEYTVREGDTLSHISKAFYGKASKWTIIYEANSDKIKDPSRVKPGTVIIIPNLEEAESKYVK